LCVPVRRWPLRCSPCPGPQQSTDALTRVWSTRSYREEGQENARAARQGPTPLWIPVGCTTFPGEIRRTPRSWVDKAYPNVIYFNGVDKGGHIAAWENRTSSRRIARRLPLRGANRHSSTIVTNLGCLDLVAAFEWFEITGGP
jgi:hypothetical protein